MHAAAAMVLFLAFGETQRTWRVEDWRAVSRLLRSEKSTAPVLVAPGLVEADDVSWYGDAAKREYLLSPFSYYPVGAPLVLLPQHIGAEERDAEKYRQGNRALHHGGAAL